MKGCDGFQPIILLFFKTKGIVNSVLTEWFLCFNIHLSLPAILHLNNTLISAAEKKQTKELKLDFAE